jgi:hypothetical protein
VFTGRDMNTAQHKVLKCFRLIDLLKARIFVIAIVCGIKKLDGGTIKSIGLLNFQSDGDI